jgi:trehalose utilization protein
VLLVFWVVKYLKRFFLAGSDTTILRQATAREKLGAVNKAHAIAKAICTKLLC